MDIDEPRARLLALAAERGVSLSALSGLIGRNASYLQQYVRKGSPRKLDEADRHKLARFFGISDTELNLEEISFTSSSSASAAESWVEIPRLALDASAGPGALVGEERAIGAFRFTASWLRAQGLEPRQLTAIAVAGNSMEPTLYDGDEILVDRTPRVWRSGVHVLRNGEALLVKRLDLGRPGRVALISDNPAYPAQDLPLQEVDILGRVVWKSGKV